MQTDAIILDDESTWPLALTRILHQHAVLLQQYEGEKIRIIQLCENNRIYQARPPENVYEQRQKNIVAEVECLLRGGTVIGYHCTRLHDEEIADILDKGLSPLSLELVEGRIRRLQMAGTLTEVIAQHLIQHNWADDRSRQQGGRSGMVWFLLTRSLLSSEDGIGISSLFRSWGGEALYACHEDKPEISSVLERIGTPCIVEAILAVDAVVGSVIGEKLVCGFLHRRGVKIIDEHEAQGYVETPVAGQRILRVIKRSHPDFEQLTACSAWSLPLQ